MSKFVSVIPEVFVKVIEEVASLSRIRAPCYRYVIHRASTRCEGARLGLLYRLIDQQTSQGQLMYA
jgi:hypothetical protein